MTKKTNLEFLIISRFLMKFDKLVKAETRFKVTWILERAKLNISKIKNKQLEIQRRNINVSEAMS